MAVPVIGYYVHHRGDGHRTRLQSIAAELTEPLTVLSSLPRPPGGPTWIQLPTDDSGTRFTEPTANGTWHWVPRHHAGLRDRMATIAGWLASATPSLMVVDVSVEVAALARLLGVPTVVVAMRGDRSDRPHRTAYDGAHALIAPWAAEFDPPDWPESWRSKAFHSGPIVRMMGRPPVPVVHDGPRRVLVFWGAGGAEGPDAGFGPDRLAAARLAAPDWDWKFAGGTGAHRVDPTAVGALLAWADVVITHAGQNAVAEVAASGTPAVVIADPRPHGEQLDTATTLATAGVAVGLSGWPEPAQWRALLDQAVTNGGAGWARWLLPDSARRTAGFLDALATELRSEPPAGTG